jgi:hypothetical protein
VKLTIIILFSILFSGCDLFSTRSAEAPTQSRANFQQAITPQLVIENLVNSLQDKNVVNYLACLSNPAYTKNVFTFSPSSPASSQYSSFSDWSEKSEEQYFNNLVVKIPSDLPITLELTNESYTPLGDSTIYSASYTLNVPTQDQSLPSTYQGTLIFGMIRDSRSIWCIYNWQDSKSSSSSLPTWSDLKGRMNY